MADKKVEQTEVPVEEVEKDKKVVEEEKPVVEEEEKKEEETKAENGKAEENGDAEKEEEAKNGDDSTETTGGDKCCIKRKSVGGDAKEAEADGATPEKKAKLEEPAETETSKTEAEAAA